ncbi:hypothetical protein EYZ11_007255 [Aspergillus tanneri]|uniref:Xylanolytic transcriptional activator regulatory domain-containing protein n=1 Tax=Aspergillus tanneri TaxID=1220188 RepID=A0A4S3JDF7_9EURO|nr:hypothetical protein EYZ11_007255 [Aspergillus tanneri]
MNSPGDNYAIHKVSVKRARQACGPCRRKKARCPGEKPTLPDALAMSQERESLPRANATGGNPVRSGCEGLPPDFVKSQVDLYLTFFHDQPYCVFSRDWLQSRADSLPPEIAFPLVALTSRLSLGASEDFGSHVPPPNPASQAWEILSNLHRDGKVGLSFLQGTCLMAQLDFADGRAHRAYASCALGLRTLQSAGLNKDLYTESLERNEAEERRRITWAFFMLDRTYNASRNYSLCLADKHFTLPFPCPNPDDSPPGSSPDRLEKPGEKANGSILACLLRLYSLWGKATEYVFEPVEKDTLPLWQAGSAFAVLESEWLQFETHFPDAHRYLNVEAQLHSRSESESRAYLSSWLCVQFLFHSIQCLMHHPFNIMNKLRQVSGNLSSTFLQKSFETSLLHSRWIARLIKEMCQTDTRPYDPFLAYLAAIAATIQLEHTVSNNPHVARLVSKEFQILVDFMTKVSAHWENIRVLVDRVRELAARRRNYGSLYYNQDGYSGALPSMPTPANIPKMSAEDEALMWDILDISSSVSPATMTQLGELIPRQMGAGGSHSPEPSLALVSQGRDQNGDARGVLLPDLSAAEMPLLDTEDVVVEWPFPSRSGSDGFGDAIPDIPGWMMLDEMAEHL